MYVCLRKVTARAVKPWSSFQCTGIHHAVRARTYKGDEHLVYALIKSMAPLPFTIQSYSICDGLQLLRLGIGDGHVEAHEPAGRPQDHGGDQEARRVRGPQARQLQRSHAGLTPAQLCAK